MYHHVPLPTGPWAHERGHFKGLEEDGRGQDRGRTRGSGFPVHVCHQPIDPPALDNLTPADGGKARATCGPGALAPPICSRVQLMCCSSFPSPRLHLPPLFTLHLLSDTYSIWFNNSLPLSFRTSSLNIHPPLFLHTFSSLLVL